jgi:transforming growth factor-beta-induced protein
VPSLLKLATLNNRAQQLKVSIGANATVAINGVQVKQADIAATNGVIHALASVLSLPGPLATALDGYPTLKSLIAAANITLPAASTVFAPAETAFTNLRIHNPALFGYLAHVTNESRTDLEMVLRYHALPEVLYAQEITVGSRAYNTLAGQSVTISKAVVNNSIEVTLSSNSTSARVESVNTLASDGVLHAIDSVLVPNSFAFTVKKILVGLNDTTLLQLLDQANLTTCLSENCQYTIFAPSQEAWGKADKSDYSRTTELLASILKSHIYPHPLAALSQNMTLTMLNNKTVHIVNNSLTLEGEARLGSARVMGNVTVGSNGYVYAIDQVLGVPLASDDSLSKKTIGWIIVGGMGGILLLAAVVVAVVWYVKRKRADSYEVINGSV